MTERLLSSVTDPTVVNPPVRPEPGEAMEALQAGQLDAAAAVYAVGAEFATFENDLRAFEAENPPDLDAQDILFRARNVVLEAADAAPDLPLGEAIDRYSAALSESGFFESGKRGASLHAQAIKFARNRVESVERSYRDKFAAEESSHRLRGPEYNANTARTALLKGAAETYSNAQSGEGTQAEAAAPAKVTESKTPIHRRPRVSAHADVPIRKQLIVEDVTDAEVVPVSTTEQQRTEYEEGQERVHPKSEEIKTYTLSNGRYSRIEARLRELSRDMRREAEDGPLHRSYAELEAIDRRRRFTTSDPMELAHLLVSLDASGSNNHFSERSLTTVHSAWKVLEKDPNASFSVSFWRDDMTGELDYGPSIFEPTRKK